MLLPPSLKRSLSRGSGTASGARVVQAITDSYHATHVVGTCLPALRVARQSRPYPAKLRVHGPLRLRTVERVYRVTQPPLTAGGEQWQRSSARRFHRSGSGCSMHSPCASRDRVPVGLWGTIEGLPEPPARDRPWTTRPTRRTTGTGSTTWTTDVSFELDLAAKLELDFVRISAGSPGGSPGFRPIKFEEVPFDMGIPPPGRRDQRRRMGGHPQVDPARAGRLLRDDRLPALPRHQRAARRGAARAGGVSLAGPLRHLGVRRRPDPGDGRYASTASSSARRRRSR